MKLKKIVVTSVMMLFMIVPGFSNETPAVKSTTPSETPVSVRGQQLVNRLEEIKAMDLETMSRAEKRKLRKEVRSIEKEMRDINEGGVYISVGGIIIILLLLILLL